MERSDWSAVEGEKASNPVETGLGQPGEREGVTPKKPAFLVEPLEEEDVSAALNKVRL